jgi:hypothetical protein
MTDMAEFKRMNYFKGFFTTADDWKGEQQYHLEKLRLHNRGLHTPGVMQGVAAGLRVRAAGGLNLEVLPGAAIDGGGNEILLPQPRLLAVPAPAPASRVMYIGIRYREAEDEKVINTAVPEYSGFKRIREVPELFVSESCPDNLLAIELARVDLQPGALTITDAVDPAAPGANCIDHRYVPLAGGVSSSPAAGALPLALQERLIQLMGRTRRDFAALCICFPSPSGVDVRQAALMIELLCRAGSLTLNGLAGMFASLADVASDAGQEIGAMYAGLAKVREYQDYTDSVGRLIDAVKSGLTDSILTRQDEVAEAARELSEVVLALPVAVAGGSTAVDTTNDAAAVQVDASASHGFGGRAIAVYRWELKNSIASPVAEAGNSFVVSTGSDETPVILNATGASAPSGGNIARYIWSKQ